jgi:hypothetical protein
MTAAKNERGDEAELVIGASAALATNAPILSMVALPGAWQLTGARAEAGRPRRAMVGRGRSSRAQSRAGR